MNIIEEMIRYQIGKWRDLGSPVVNWGGRTLVFKEDYAEAMAALSTPEEAALFVAEFRSAYPSHTEWLLGWLTDDVDPDYRAGVRALIGVECPIPKDILHLPPERRQSVILAWCYAYHPGATAAVMAIPRRDMRLYFDDTSNPSPAAASIPFYECGKCGSRNYNPDDVAVRYCSQCGEFSPS